ncbi:hypothetical protein PM082_024238 [Marasmius tenuissimus]|nr:hypothetical protein PM082_024238 [Marasmius tenuissimus]
MLPGQLARKQLPAEKIPQLVKFATQKPDRRLRSITNGVNVLQLGQSDYIKQFGMKIHVENGPLTVRARVLKPPTLRYGSKSREPTIAPSEGVWNMVGKEFSQPATIPNWFVAIYETKGRFGVARAKGMVTSFIEGCESTGITIKHNPVVKWIENTQGDVTQQLRDLGSRATRDDPSLIPPVFILAVIPEGGNDIYSAVKHFGDCMSGIATQCVKSAKAISAKQNYWACVALKVNVKLGGTNVVPDPSSVVALMDPNQPTIVMGADVCHPSPGDTENPSYAALVSSTDSATTKYTATCRIQAARRELIEDLEGMVKVPLFAYWGPNINEATSSLLLRRKFYNDTSMSRSTLNKKSGPLLRGWYSIEMEWVKPSLQEYLNTVSRLSFRYQTDSEL